MGIVDGFKAAKVNGMERLESVDCNGPIAEEGQEKEHDSRIGMLDNDGSSLTTCRRFWWRLGNNLQQI